ncbi:site-specific integrase [Alkalihalophilus pseudofirmus]|uniref:tyrosine-type recombinase/integrase n=1 Tax=Alkalihalophilus pseudofirmus TaxID=79885 RepID=UPI00259AF957|nr:site-specific integrase [Alkalihalophilus pseudofirmus]WEG18497.1 site-specific integrase [Alkalihalophilus pseudofirmus]
MSEIKIEKNMLRERAKKLPDVTPEMWSTVSEDHRELVKEFLEVNTFRKKTFLQYTSALKQFFYWVETSLNGKPLYKISKRDFLRYLSFLKNRGMSSSGQALKKAAVSSLNNYIENIVAEDDDRYEKFRNFTRGLPPIPKTQTYDKVKITYEEYQDMMKVLESDENYLGMAWLSTAFNVGARRAEIIQFKTEILDYEIPEGQNYVLSHLVMGKGTGEGKPLNYMINKEALEYMKKWIDKRDYECEYIFSTKYKGEPKMMSESWADYFCSDILSDILGRRINPHIFKASAITYLLEIKKVPLEIVSKFVAQHNDVSTTIKHYDLRDFEEERNQIF